MYLGRKKFIQISDGGGINLPRVGPFSGLSATSIRNLPNFYTTVSAFPGKFGAEKRPEKYNSFYLGSPLYRPGYFMGFLWANRVVINGTLTGSFVDGGGGVGACDGEHGEVGEAGGGSVQGKAGKVVSEKHCYT
jgi:hypothetical protein